MKRDIEAKSSTQAVKESDADLIKRMEAYLHEQESVSERIETTLQDSKKQLEDFKQTIGRFDKRLKDTSKFETPSPRSLEVLNKLTKQLSPRKSIFHERAKVTAQQEFPASLVTIDWSSSVASTVPAKAKTEKYKVKLEFTTDDGAQKSFTHLCSKSETHITLHKRIIYIHEGHEVEAIKQLLAASIHTHPEAAKHVIEYINDRLDDQTEYHKHVVFKGYSKTEKLNAAFELLLHVVNDVPISDEAQRPLKQMGSHLKSCYEKAMAAKKIEDSKDSAVISLA